MLRIAICDDDAAFLEKLALLLEKYFSDNCVIVRIDKFNSGYLLIEDIEKNRKTFDCVFLDIEMPTVNGYIAARRLRELNAHIILIFITNLDNEAPEGYKYGAFRFILKRRLEADTKEAVNAVIQSVSFVSRDGQKVCVKYLNDNLYENINIAESDIIYLHMDKSRRVRLKTPYADYELLVKPLKYYLSLLDNDSFAIITRSYILNFNHVADMDEECFILTDNEKISLGYSRATRQNSKNKFMKFLKSRM